eukprot:TRINITY_DN12014_c0_g1_i1.p1 TRINITY_DN12014_c0_g1~~TRINITY_DN12014_c0_g1_i1.p1  ORF type:complete len:183 (+),score=19.56 TRINITY_DN12014_c0_g1_i1:111-659(+)
MAGPALYREYRRMTEQEGRNAVPSDNVDDLRPEPGPHPRVELRQSDVTVVPGPSNQPTKLFGSRLTMSAVREITNALRWLEEHHIQQEGLWRQSGDKAEAARLQQDANMTHGLGLYPELNPHTLVTCLYYWMQEIPGGLMSGECVGALESVNAQAGCTSVELCQVSVRLTAICILFLALSEK